MGTLALARGLLTRLARRLMTSNNVKVVRFAHPRPNSIPRPPVAPAAGDQGVEVEIGDLPFAVASDSTGFAFGCWHLILR